jgi:hypothetical protein
LIKKEFNEALLVLDNSKIKDDISVESVLKEELQNDGQTTSL